MKFSVLLPLLLSLAIALLPEIRQQAVAAHKHAPFRATPEVVHDSPEMASTSELHAVGEQPVGQARQERASGDVSDRIDELLRLGQDYVHTNVDSAFYYVYQLHHALEGSDNRFRDRDYYNLVFELTGIIELGFERRAAMLIRLATFADEKNDNYELMQVLRRLSHLYYHVSLLDKALEYQLQAKEVANRPGVPAFARIFPYVSLAHIHTGRPEGVLYADSALAMVDSDNTLPPRALYWIHTHVGSFYESINSTGEALVNFKIAQDISSENPALPVDPVLVLGLGRIYLAVGEDEKARRHLQLAAQQSTQYAETSPEVQVDIAAAMMALAEKTNQFSEVEEYALRIIAIGRYSGYLKQRRLAHRTLYEVYRQWELESQAFLHLAQYFAISDRLAVREKNNESYLDARALEIARKQLEVAANLKVQTERIFTARVVLGCLILICVIFLYSWQKQRWLAGRLLAKNKEIESYNAALVAINEQLIEARDRAEESDRIKTAILQNMSHEIRTPLTSILGYAELMKDGGPSMEIACQIQRGGRRLMDMLTSVMDLAQLESGTVILNVRPFEICGVVRNIVAQLTPHAREKGLKLVFDEANARKINVVTDLSAIKRITRNLINNAIHFTADGSIVVKLYRKSNYMVLRVSDTGIGIDPGFLPLAFEPFRQESEGHGRTHEGVGLGLAVAKQFVELMAGRISVTSKKGVGSVFTVVLPILPADSGTVSDSSPAASTVIANEEKGSATSS